MRTIKTNIKWHQTVLLFIFLIQLAVTCAYLPATEWFTENPIYTDDFPHHYADILYKRDCINSQKMFLGYNPDIRAGTVNQAIYTVDNYGWALFTLFLSAKETAA